MGFSNAFSRSGQAGVAPSAAPATASSSLLRNFLPDRVPSSIRAVINNDGTPFGQACGGRAQTGAVVFRVGQPPVALGRQTVVNRAIFRS